LSAEGVVAVTVYTARAVHWSGGWELHVDGVGVTQVRILAKATQQVRDLIQTYTGRPTTGDVITIVTDPEIDQRAELVRRRTTEAAQAQAEAAKAAREFARDLRHQGLSVSDIAEVMGVTRGRVSQFLSSTGRSTQAPTAPKRIPA